MESSSYYRQSSPTLLASPLTPLLLLPLATTISIRGNSPLQNVLRLMNNKQASLSALTITPYNIKRLEEIESISNAFLSHGPEHLVFFLVVLLRSTGAATSSVLSPYFY